MKITTLKKQVEKLESLHQVSKGFPALQTELENMAEIIAGKHLAKLDEIESALDELFEAQDKALRIAVDAVDAI